MKRRERRESFPCPYCGADVPSGAAACRECGADTETGWSEDAEDWESDVPTGYGSEEDFDYDEFIQQEFPEQGSDSWERTFAWWAWRIVVLLVCLSLLAWLFVP